MTKRARIPVPALLLCLAVFLPVRAEVNPLTCLPQETGLVARIHLKEALDSPLGAEFLDAFGDKYAAICNFCQTAAGFDFAETHTIWLIAPRPNVNALILQVPVIADDVRRAFGALPEVTVLDDAGCPFAARFFDKKENKKKLAAVLDDGTLLVGDEKWTETVLNTWRGRHPARKPDTPELQWLSETTATAAAVFVGGPSRWPDFNPFAGSLIRDLRAKADVDENLRIDLFLGIVNPGAAEGIAQIAQGALTLLRNAQPPKPLPWPVRLALESAEVAYQGQTVRLTATIPRRKISELLAPRRAARPAGVPQP